jgi:hypothetical protein
VLDWEVCHGAETRPVHMRLIFLWLSIGPDPHDSTMLTACHAKAIVFMLSGIDRIRSAL